MTAERAQRSQAAGWLTTLLGAAILIVLGFGVGLVAGAAFEEPDLVLDHVSGRTAVAELPVGERGVGADPGTRGLAAVPAPVPPPAPEERPLGAPREAVPAAPPAPAPPAPPPLAAAPAPPPAPLPAVSSRGGGFAIQVGAFAERSAADALVSALQKGRHPAYVVEGVPGERVRYRVRVGPYARREEATQVAGRLEKEQGLPTWVVAEDAP